MIIFVTDKETQLTNTLRMTTEALRLITIERDELKVQLLNAREYAEKMLHAAINAKRKLDSQNQSNELVS